MKYIRKTSYDIKNNFLKNLLKDRSLLNDNEQYNASFARPQQSNLEDPKHLNYIQDGYELLKSAFINEQTIYLPVDCDADGYTSAALFYLYCKDVLEEKWTNNKINIVYHIPEGKEHGLRTIMNWFPQDGNENLIVLPDSSSNDYEQHKELMDRGYRILVLDHHEAPKYSDDAIVINNQLSEHYENKCLSGVGVVYKFFQYIEEVEGWTDYSTKYLDLVATGEISDVMLMTTLENRFICDYGLSHINNTFLKEIIKKQAYSIFGISTEQWRDIYYTNGQLTQINIAFYITPLINALIRVGNSLEKERLFQAFITPHISVPSTKRGEKGMEETICTQAIRNCINAKSRQTKERDKAAELLDIQILNNNLNENKILILSADDLEVNNTLTGLCAMGVAARHKKPVMLGRTTPDGKTIKGSIRNFDGSPLTDFKAFLNASHLVDYVEGHPGAAGFALPVKNLSQLINYANTELKDMDFNEGYYEVDFVVNGNCSYLKDLIFDLNRGAKYWGQGCPEAKVLVENLTLGFSDYQVIGKNADTLKFSYNGITYIKFKAEDLIDKMSEYKDTRMNISVVGTSNVNDWGGNRTPQILIQDIEIKESSALDF